MFRRARILPDVPIYGFIGGIPEHFGGRTSVCLQRANAFAELDDRRVEILTLSPGHGLDPESLTLRLREEGRIGERVTIRNVWSDLRRASDEDLRLLAGQARPSAAQADDELLESDGSFDARRRSPGGKVLQVDRFRADGSCVVSYRLDTRVRGEPGGRRVTLLARDGAPVGQWTEQYFLYFAWMDWVLGTGPAVLINDGPSLAEYLFRYRRDNVIFVQTIHSRHSSAPSLPTGKISTVYLPTVKHMESFDRVAVLTEAQHRDLLDVHYAKDNVDVLPNMVVGHRLTKLAPRNPSTGVMLARLTYQKRVDHAVRAISHARRQGIAATLDIYGVIDEAEAHIEALISELDLDGSVGIRGYDPRAKSRFADASFTFLTSQYEGQGLALLEAMAAGCLPIAYDIAYGPSDVITDGVNGFLVPNGDVDALAERVVRIGRMNERALAKMRKAAIRRSDDFSPTEITRRWGCALSRALAHKVPVEDLSGSARLKSVDTAGDVVSLTLAITGDAANSPSWAMLTFADRLNKSFGRVPARMRASGKSVLVDASVPTGTWVAMTGGIIDFWVDLRVRGNPVRLRLRAGKVDLPRTAGSYTLYRTKYGGFSAGITSPSRG